MPEQTPGLDNPAFRGRLRQPGDWRLSSAATTPVPRRRSDYTAPAPRPSPRNYRPAMSSPVNQPLPIASQPAATPTMPLPQPVAGAGRQFMREPDGAEPQVLRSHRYSKLQLSLVGMAVMVFISGLAVSLQALQTNHSASAQVSALAKRTDKQAAGAVPSTTEPNASAFNSYAVAPDLPRYLKIPKLGVNARVLQVGVDGSGALSAPSNVFDTAWYTGSAKPGQAGATLIDGHVSSWTTHGVFYGIKTLQAGDTIQVVRGDNTAINYRVVKTQVYPDNNVDMQAAITPVTPGKSGLNLITCAGQVKKGTSEFNQRVIVFAEQT